MPLPAIEITHLSTQFGKMVIHEDVNMTIQQQEIVAIIGGSGTGKSTILREIILLERPISGSIKVLGREVLGLSDRQAQWLRRECGMMFQNGALFSSLTVAENVAIPLQEHTQLSKTTIAELVAYKIALVGLPPTAGNKYPSQLSGGMIKRAAVARALALDPKILFLDEPTAGLDPVGADSLDDMILQLRELLGLTIVIVTHDLDTLWKVTDRIAVLADKKVLAVEPIRDLLKIDHAWLKEYFHGVRGRVTAYAHEPV
ncbi:ABC transporter ATP-binding protein [Beggiatoa leptomitoformis]|uniref:ATP-binding cassette domain-containing protein n=1 Tax=Beggiatoa leptomitoformis TaxID=288004 RepID=A0A2N9YC55_9GAMM|nr:ATP-binding cassette domain-containing protein [Beggiatoa leptomitoformis]ALG66629.1 ATP-binding cassette domain-containing protein [Beggiatoa leptomitoformis]AUI68057.1 ATP-binding cassette domain-containing protein [Beggiatoa leptomitoformis]